MFCPKCGNPVNSVDFMCEKCGQILKNPEENTGVEPVSRNSEQNSLYTGPDTPVQSYAPPVYQPPVVPVKRENILTGIVGALIGAAIGALSIILLSQLNIVAAISGLILAVCTLKGYELLGGKLSKTGVVICVVLMLVTPYFADRLDWAIVLMSELSDYNLSLGDAFGLIPTLLEVGAIESSTYYLNLGMLYLFVLIGGFSTVSSSFKKRK